MIRGFDEDFPTKTTILGDQPVGKESLGSQAFAMSSAGRSPTAGVPEASWGQRRYRFCQGKSVRLDIINNWYPP